MPFSLSLPVGSMQCLPEQTGTRAGLKQGAGLAKDSYGVIPCTFGSKLQSQETGKTLVLEFSSHLFPPH